MAVYIEGLSHGWSIYRSLGIQWIHCFLWYILYSVYCYSQHISLPVNPMLQNVIQKVFDDECEDLHASDIEFDFYFILATVAQWFCFEIEKKCWEFISYVAQVIRKVTFE